MTKYIQTENELLLKSGIEELRRLHDSIWVSFEGMRTKALALLAGEVASITFLFSASSKFSVEINYAYSIVLWGIGVLLLGVAFLLLLSIVSPTSWHHPPETKDLRDMKKRFNDSNEEFLVYLKNEYIESIELCIQIISVKSRRFVWSIFSISIGIFLIALLKFGSFAVILN